MAKGALVEFVLDQLDGIDKLAARSMFGGIGLYADAVFFAIIHRDTLYFKVDDTTRATYQRARMKPFRPFADRPTTLQYYQVPARVLEDRETLTRWAREAIAVATRKSRPRTP